MSAVAIRPKRTKERAATLVEFAFIMPILLLVLISFFEVGMAFRSFLTNSYLTREGARLSAFLGTDVDADCSMITSLSAGMTTSDLTALDRIEVFRADSNGNQVTADTNTFRFTGTDPSNCAHWTSVITWPSTGRQTEVGAQPLDVIGVRLVTTHRWVTQFPPFAGTLNINENTIVRMEPEAFA